MAIFKRDKEITSINHGSRIVMAVYHGTRLIWESIRSCFGKGFWVNESSWNNEDGWKNN